MTSPSTNISTKMRAWRCYAFNESAPTVIDELKLEQEVPTLSAPLLPSQVLIQVAYAAVNPIDWRVMMGSRQAVAPIASFPYTPGFDVCGVVVQVGDDGNNMVQVGDRVCALIGLLETLRDPPTVPQGPAGGLAEYAVVFVDHVAKLATGTSWQQVAGLGLSGLTSYQCLFTGHGQSRNGQPLGKLQASQKVLILGGASGAGLLAIQLAAAAGCHVATTASNTTISSPRDAIVAKETTKIDLCKDMGANHVIDYQKDDWSDVLAGHEYDVIFDCVGRQQDLDLAPKVLKRDGTGLYVSIANAKGTPPDGDVKALIFAVHVVQASGRDLQYLVDQVEAGKLQVLVEQVYDFEDVPAALHHSFSGRTVGKSVISIGGEL